MITIQNGKFSIPENERFIGFAGDNLRKKIEFLVKDEANLGDIHRLYLTFDDDSVNFFVLPSRMTSEGLVLTWDILEAHIFKSGIVKVQIKAFCNDGVIWHSNSDTLIVGKTAEFPDTPDSMKNTEFLEYERALNEIRDEIESGKNLLPYIGENDNWFVAGVDTGVKAKGEDGEDALTYHIYYDEEETAPDIDTLTTLGVYHFQYASAKYILLVDSFTNLYQSHLIQIKISAEGLSYRTKLSEKYQWTQWSDLCGTDGNDGVTPHIGDNGNWYLGETDTGVKAQGNDGETPEVVINPLPNLNGNNVSFVTAKNTVGMTVYNGEKGEKGDKGEQGAQGLQGIQGPKGDTGEKGADGITPRIGSNGNWFISNTDTGVSAYGTDTFVPEYWQTTIDSLKETIEEKQASGKDAFQFVWFSDMHGKTGYINANGAGKSSQTYLGAVSQKLCEQYNIPFVAVSGDIMSQTDFPNVSSVHQQYADCNEILSAIDTDKLLMTIGNHDGAWGGSTVIDGVTQNYLKDIGNKALYNKVFRRQATAIDRVFGENGTYFYVDSKPQKIRFIMLNTNTDGDGSNDENGYAVYNSMKNNVLGTKQLQWLENVALEVPEGYGVVIMGHIQPKAWSDEENAMVWNIKDGELLSNILTAYKNRTSYESESIDLSDEYWGDSDSTPVPAYTNLFDASTVKLNTRVNSSGNEVTLNGCIVIPDLPFTTGDVLRINLPEAFSNGNTKIISFYGAGSKIGADGGAQDVLPLAVTETEVSYTVGHYLKSGVDTLLAQAVTKVDIALYLSSSPVTAEDIPEIIITKNEEIVDKAPSQSEYLRSETISKDFENAKGELIAYFHGHIHKDSVDSSWLPIPSISITTAGGDVRDANPTERVPGTATETAMDIVTIDKSTRTIYMTRLGVGEDRQIDY